jgi:hypothetical protein
MSGLIAGAATEPSTAAPRRGPHATFIIEGDASAFGAGDPPSATVAEFKSAFFADLAAIDTWFGEAGWPLTNDPDLRVHISDRYRISRSLVPAWHGHTGRMEFPTARVVSRKSAIAHEQVHVYRPNGNRLLAEGLAIYVQQLVGGNPAFPNFGRPLHENARGSFVRLSPAFATSGSIADLEDIRVRLMDQIATPSPLSLDVAGTVYGEEPRGQGLLYPFAGSFVEFLIETRGLPAFRALYERTPMVPGVTEAGTANRWRDHYASSLEALEAEWTSVVAAFRNETHG